VEGEDGRMTGVAETKELLNAGFTQEEVARWQAEESTKMFSAGFSQAEINAYWGQPEPNEKAMRGVVDEIVAKTRMESPEKEMGIAEALTAGWQISALGLGVRGKSPAITVPEDADRAVRIAANVAQLAGDVPFMVAGSVMGTAAGGSLGALAGPAGGAIGAVIGGGAGGFALPEVVRQVLMDEYENGSLSNFNDFWDRLGGIAFGTGKAAVVGAATTGVGGAAAKVVAPLAVPGAVKGGASLASEIATMVSVGKALEGEVPKADDFLDAAIVILGFKGATAAAGKLRKTYAKTGVTPQQVAQAAQTHPSVAQDLASSNTAVPRALAGEPKPEVKAEPAAASEPELNAAQAAVLARVSVGEPQKTGYTLDKFYADVKDYFFPTRRLVEKITGTKEKLPTGEDPYQLERLTRGSFGKADQFLEYAPFEYATYVNTGAKPLRAILEPFKTDLQSVRAYAVAARTAELEARGIHTGVPIAEARAVVAAGGKKYAAMFKELQEYQDSSVKYLRDAGVVSAEAVEAMREANRDFVPFFRVMEEGETGGKAGAGLSVKNPIKGIRGSDRKIVDPLESIIKNTYLYILLAERNAVGQALVNLAKNTPQSHLVEKVEAKIKPIEVTSKEVDAILADYGLTAAQADAFTIFRAQSLNPAANQIVVFRNGKRELYEVDPDVAAAFKATDRETTPLLAKIIGLPASTLRAGAVLSPDFMLRNVSRDQLSAFIFSRSGYVPILDAVRGAISIAKRDSDFQNWLKSGGANATLVAMDREFIQSKLFDTGVNRSLSAHAWNVAKAPLELLRIGSELLENATRLGEFKKAAKGRTSKEALQAAGFASREVTLDFARIGAKARAMNMITAFFNARVEGLDRTVRAAKDNPLGFVAKSLAAITLPSVLLWWANKDDPRWRQIPQWQKDLFWIVMTDEHIYRIPKPFELGILFGTIPERLLDAFFTDNPAALRDFDHTVMGMFGTAFVPTLAAPLVEQFANRSLFTGAPTIPYGTEGLLGEAQYSDYTTETSKALGQLLGRVPGVRTLAADEASFLPGGAARAITSPALMENYIRGWTGPLGMYTLQLADKGLRAAGVVPDPVEPLATLADLPVIKAFVIRYPSAAAQNVQDFYNDYEKRKRIYDTWKYYVEKGDSKAADRVAAIDASAFVQLDGVREGLSTMSSLIQMINQNPEYTPEEKRQLIDTVYFRMSDMADYGNEMLRESERLFAD